MNSLSKFRSQLVIYNVLLGKEKRRKITSIRIDLSSPETITLYMVNDKWNKKIIMINEQCAYLNQEIVQVIVERELKILRAAVVNGLMTLNYRAQAIQGVQGDWTAFGECSTSCDGGQKLFIRTCNHGSLPGHLSVACDGENYEYKTCNLGGCPGSWSCWEDDGHCSTSCGNGTQIRRRRCDNLAPTNVGNECPGDNVTYVHCNIIECPVYKWGHLKEQNLTKDDLKDIMQEELNEIKNNLTIDSKNISATIRKHISARDDRPSAASVGYLGVALLVVPLVMIILADAPKVFAVVASIYRKVCS
ncbi:unnamed protein product [Mytilus edulis]|uniref:Uncharacterized protein n=1 Tax=Mytilus edulis TaxID=6550 RepID=A0A8S3TJA2_MYTED|nr:unnamed protein product [Mytilus edulis]